MEFSDLEKAKLKGVLPKEIKESTVCFTYVNSKVIDEAPDIATCNTNKYMYEVKNNKILSSLNLEDTPSSISCNYLIEHNKLVIFYLVFTTSNRLLVIRRTNKRLKVVKEYHEVKRFQVYDYGSLGVPQIKINFLNKSESFICDFPIEPHVEPKYNAVENAMSVSLSEELEDLNKYIDTLTEEHNQIMKICFSNDSPINVEKISVGSSNFSLVLNNERESQLLVHKKWFKVFETYLILGMTLCNIGSEIIDGLDFIINNQKIKNYGFSFFQSSCDISRYLFSAERFNGFLRPGEEMCAVASFEVPEFYTESELIIECYVTSKNLRTSFLKETFEINVCDIALQTNINLEERFTVEDLLAILAIKSETRLKIRMEDFEDSLLESLLVKSLGFKLIKHVKDKLFYCTSTYLKEVFVALQHIAKNPSVWKMAVYTSREKQIPFFVNTLYELLPENSVVLCDESAGICVNISKDKQAKVAQTSFAGFVSYLLRLTTRMLQVRCLCKQRRPIFLANLRIGMWVKEKIFHVLDLWPGKEKLGLYRYLPIFFVTGAIIEYSMIHWRPNGINFYEKFKAKHAHEEALKRWENWKEIEKIFK